MKGLRCDGTGTGGDELLQRRASEAGGKLDACELTGNSVIGLMFCDRGSEKVLQLGDSHRFGGQGPDGDRDEEDEEDESAH